MGCVIIAILHANYVQVQHPVPDVLKGIIITKDDATYYALLEPSQTPINVFQLPALLLETATLVPSVNIYLKVNVM